MLPHSAPSAVPFEMSESDKTRCAQCGVIAFPHSACRCPLCGRIHLKSRGCSQRHLLPLSAPAAPSFQLIESDKTLCDQCGVIAFPHSACRCRLCGRIHLKSRVCSQRQPLAPLQLQISKSIKVPCSQCGAVAYPHTRCRCIACGRRHLKSTGCVPCRCKQCGEFAAPHDICHCLNCHRVHSHRHQCMPQTSPSEQRGHLENVRCPQCGLQCLPHNRCRCLLCGRTHLHSSRCRVPRVNKKNAAMNGSIPSVANVGSMDKVCPFCHSRSWASETISCCASGDIVLSLFPPIPAELSAVILSPHVQDNIRSYNMAMAMASTGHKNISLPDGMFVLGGKTFHRVGSLVPPDTHSHAFAQIYILDTEQATERRLEVQGSSQRRTPLRPSVLSQLHRFMMQYNPCVQQFVAAAHENLPRLVWRCSDDISTMQMGALVVQSGAKRDIVIQHHVSCLLRSSSSIPHHLSRTAH